MSSEIDRALDKAGDWFENVIISNHIKNTRKLKTLNNFNINPMLLPYLGYCASGSVNEIGIASALVYPRVLGSSITTSFGNNLQTFITDVVADSFGSVTAGLDIEFRDKIDNRVKYAQIKLGPNTINSDDVDTIHNHFKEIRGRARIHRLGITQQDYVVGVMYGSPVELNGHYKKLRDEMDYTVLVGIDFWEHLTGDKLFFSKLTDEFRARANAASVHAEIQEVIKEIAETDYVKNLVRLMTT